MKQQMNFRLAAELVEAIRQHAEDEHRTVTQVVELALMEYFVRRGEKLDGVEIPRTLTQRAAQARGTRRVKRTAAERTKRAKGGK